MATFSAANVEALTDRLGAIWAALVAMGGEAEADSVRTGTDTLKADIEALSIEKGLIAGTGSVALQAAMLDIEGLAAPSFTALIRALNSDLGTFNAFALANSIMYSSDFRDLAAECGITITATYVYKMTPQTLATFAATGATTGTLVTTGALDTSLYGPLPCEIFMTSDISSSTTVNNTMVKSDATTQVKTVNLTTADDTGETAAIGVSTDRYVDCSNITVTGATSGDTFTVRTKVLRTPSVS